MPIDQLSGKTPLSHMQLNNISKYGAIMFDECFRYSHKICSMPAGVLFSPILSNISCLVTGLSRMSCEMSCLSLVYSLPFPITHKSDWTES